MRGIEPRTFHMQSERSTTELQPQLTNATCLQKEKINTYVSFWKLLSSPKMHFIKLSSVIKLTCSNISIELCPCSLIIRFHLAWKISVFCVVIYEVHATSWRHLHTWRWRSCWRCLGKVSRCRSEKTEWGGDGCAPTYALRLPAVHHLLKNNQVIRKCWYTDMQVYTKLLYKK